MCYTNIQPKLENRHLSGVKWEKNTFYFSKDNLIVTLTLLTDVLARQIEQVLLLERNQEI